MPINNKTIPSLSGLILFEASARLGTFTNAANELCVTPTAVAKQIKQLEAFLDTQLFYRKKTGVELTTEGNEYLVHVSQALNTLAEASTALQKQDRPIPLNLEIGTCFSHFWLIPRLDDFRSRYPEVTLNISINNERNIAENAIAPYDASFYYAPIDSVQKENYLLFDERMLLVCSPGFLKKRPDCRDLTTLWDQPLLGLRDAPEFWENWQSWAQRSGKTYRTPTNMMVMEDQIAVIQAALNDAGIALAWDWHIEQLLESKQLIALTPPLECYNNAFFLSCSDNANRKSAQRFIRWVMEQLKVPR